jgi:hypothetical protein
MKTSVCFNPLKRKPESMEIVIPRGLAGPLDAGVLHLCLAGIFLPRIAASSFAAA